jgi:hypothetical protein
MYLAMDNVIVIYNIMSLMMYHIVHWGGGNCHIHYSLDAPRGSEQGSWHLAGLSAWGLDSCCVE